MPRPLLHGVAAPLRAASLRRGWGDGARAVVQTAAFAHGVTLCSAVAFGSCAIRLYGDTCGVSIFEPRTWARPFIVMGSSWCKSLHWIAYSSTYLVEHMWMHLVGLAASCTVCHVSRLGATEGAPHHGGEAGYVAHIEGPTSMARRCTPRASPPPDSVYI
jgi:hypothetical protein